MSTPEFQALQEEMYPVGDKKKTNVYLDSDGIIHIDQKGGSVTFDFNGLGTIVASLESIGEELHRKRINQG